MDEINFKEVAIMDAGSGSIDIYTLPHHVRTDNDLQDYLHLTLEMDSNCDWIGADNIVISDFRTKPK